MRVRQSRVPDGEPDEEEFILSLKILTTPGRALIAPPAQIAHEPRPARKGGLRYPARA